MSNNNDMYSINNYTEEECFEILGLDTDPTDDELENAIKNQPINILRSSFLHCVPFGL